jgi:hypothetical protein
VFFACPAKLAQLNFLPHFAVNIRNSNISMFFRKFPSPLSVFHFRTTTSIWNQSTSIHNPNPQHPHLLHIKRFGML